MTIKNPKKFWITCYFLVSILIFLFRYKGWEYFHWPLDIFCCFTLILTIKSSVNFEFKNFKLAYFYFFFITLGTICVSFFHNETFLLFGIISYLISRIIFNSILEKEVSEKKFSSLKYNVILVATLFGVLALSFLLVGDYLPLNFSLFVILFSFIHGLNLNYLFYLENSLQRFPLILSALALGFHDLLGAINIFYKIIDYNFLIDYVLLVVGNFSLAVAVIYLSKELKIKENLAKNVIL